MNYDVPPPAAAPPHTPAPRGRPRGSTTGTGPKRGRKPRGAASGVGTGIGRGGGTLLTATTPTPSSSGLGGGASPNPSAQYPRVHWAMPTIGGAGVGAGTAGEDEGGGGSGAEAGRAGTPLGTGAASGVGRGAYGGANEEEDGVDDELLPAMADDDYSAQLSWQSQSKDNLKVLMDNFSQAQYDRFEAYRRHALPKQAVRKVIQQTVGQQVSQPVAQIVAGFAKVFVGEIIEKARKVQQRRGESGPLSPDHLREAYRAYQEETGHVGAARAGRAKKLFVR